MDKQDSITREEAIQAGVVTLENSDAFLLITLLPSDSEDRSIQSLTTLYGNASLYPTFLQGLEKAKLHIARDMIDIMLGNDPSDSVTPPSDEDFESFLRGLTDDSSE